MRLLACYSRYLYLSSDYKYFTRQSLIRAVKYLNGKKFLKIITNKTLIKSSYYLNINRE